MSRVGEPHMYALGDKKTRQGFDAARVDRRHLVTSLLVVLIEALMCFGYGVVGHASLSVNHLLVLMFLIWGTSLLLAWTAYFYPHGWLRGRRQVVLLTLWASSCFLVTSFFLNQFRISAVMFFFPILLMASFRLKRLALFFISSYMVVGYLVVLLLVWRLRPLTFNYSLEGLQWIIFAISTYCVVLSGSMVSQARSRLAGINRELQESVKHAEEASTHDDLTGLFNRRHILEILRQQKAMADAGSYDFVVCYLDLDHFKAINDRYGHGVGDQVLSRASRIMQLSLRDADYCGRMGGEEFLLVLTNVTMPAAREVAERLRWTLAKQNFTGRLDALQVTASVGLAQSVPGETASQLLTRADQCLYEAKETGRNKVVCWER